MDANDYYREKFRKDRRNIVVAISVVLLIVFIPILLEVRANKKAEEEVQRKYADIIEDIEEIGKRTEESRKRSEEAKEKLLKDLEYLE